MSTRFRAAALTLVLAGSVGFAAAQSGSGDEKSSSSQGSTQEKLHLNRGQEQAIINGLGNERAQSNQPGYQGQPGAKVPDSMATRQLPEDVTDQVPQIKGYYFVKLPDKVLLLDPDTKMVIEIVTGEETTGASSGADKSQSGASSPGR
jgi:hypothetical protein